MPTTLKINSGLAFDRMIEIPEEVIDYFGSFNSPTFWLLPKVIEQDSALGKALREISEQLDAILNSDGEVQSSLLHQLAHLARDSQRIMGLSHLITEAIARRRLLILASDYESQQVRPYNHPDLSGIEPDANGLAELSDFDTSLGGLKRGSSVFEVLPSIPTAVNSMYWANRILTEVGKKF